MTKFAGKPADRILIATIFGYEVEEIGDLTTTNRHPFVVIIQFGATKIRFQFLAQKDKLSEQSKEGKKKWKKVVQLG